MVANESYTDFVSGLQAEIKQTLSRTQKFDLDFFKGKQLKLNGQTMVINDDLAEEIYFHFRQNGLIDKSTKTLTEKFTQAKTNGDFGFDDTLKPYQEAIIALITQNEQSGVPVENANKQKINPLNANFNRKEFQQLWQKIHHKAVYQVDFDSQELIQNAVRALDRELKITPLIYIVESGTQEKMDHFSLNETTTNHYNVTLDSHVKYDLVGTVAKNVDLTRKTVASIFSQIRRDTFAKFAQNPEQFISESSRLIKEQLATIFVERLSYHQTNEVFETTLFTAEQQIKDVSKAVIGLKKHIYDFAMVDSQGIERNFVEALDKNSDVVVYAKLPRGFAIPTPVGDYNPDWAVSFKEGTVKHIYFIAETKGSISSMDLRGTEKAKIDCAKKFFAKISADTVCYDVVKDFDGLMSLVK